jgi:hypothetical protein
MNNIHILPTDKPSRLHNKNGELGNYPSTKLYIEDFKGNQHNSFHIYITNDEKIKEGDYVIWNGKVYKDSKRSFTGVDYSQCKKIILTTDTDLIKNGIQAIDDEFLEWFVKNPSCESVDVTNDYEEPLGDCYKIIIPQEEPKEIITPESFIQDIATRLGKTIPETVKHIEKFKEELDKLKSQSKQETLEEASKRAVKSGLFKDETLFIAGAKWQQERMYS